MGNKTAVVYARYSSHRQGEQSIEGQLAAAHKYASEHELRIIHEYCDRATTGRNDNREQFQTMLRDAAKKQFDVIILWKIDRFGRNREEIAFNKYRCKKYGVKVVYVAESIPDSPEGVILESVLEGMAEYYSLQLSQNVLRGQRASAEKCQSTGGTHLLGYTTDPKTKKFIVDDSTAPTVRLIFDRYSKGNTIADIVRELNDSGLRTQRGAAFTRNSLHAMLKNEKYIGIYTYNDIRIEDGIPAIIDKATFADVQTMLRANKKAPARKWNKAEYILTDKLFCGNCGANMIGESGTSKTGKKHNYYICSKRKRVHLCDKKAIRQESIESVVVSKITELIADEGMLNALVDGVYAYYQKINDDNKYINSLNKQLADVDKRTANLMKAIEAGIINETTKKRMDELEEQRSEIEFELLQNEKTKALRLTRDHIWFLLNQFNNMDTSDIKVQKRMIDTFVNAIFVYDDDRPSILTLNYSGDKRTVTLADIESITTEGESVRMPCGALYHSAQSRTQRVVVWRNIFVILLTRE